ncbi:non-homologous end-joining DNA ligase [Kitasatospora sp. NPDC096147]|uniref:non-homologous end-joining DNA ligase n=1 Tax=Kitasatospora sp. NPDC096147 TaxID=3364093 RepID=UPI00381A457A
MAEQPEVVHAEVGGRRLRLTHLEKVLYPETGWTKAEAVHYYASVAPKLLPHLAGRPASFLRFPEGVQGQRFWAKRVPGGSPGWLSTLEVPHREGAFGQVVVADLPTLVWAANLGALELHVPQWQGDPDHHDRLVIDLDPGPGMTVVECCAVALAAGRLLAADGLTAFAKTSGSKGLHLLVPLHPAPERAAVEYARQLAGQLRAAAPGLVVDRMEKSLRRGRIFVDWSQNTSAKTTVAPYSLRAGERPTVSTPVPWSAVESCRRPADLEFTPEQVLARPEDPMAELTAPRLRGRLPGA